VVGAPLSL